MIKSHHGKWILVNYADEKYKRTQRFNSLTGKLFGGFDEIVECSPLDIDEEYKLKNRDIFSVKRGAGLWLWKPYMILKVLDTMDYGDILFYCDAGSFFIRNVSPLIETIDDNDIWVCNLPLIESDWTDPNVIEKLCVDNPENIINSQQIQGTFIIIRKSEYSENVIKQWQKLCEHKDLLKGTTENCDHREDQSLLSILLKTNNIHPHKDPTQYGRIPWKYNVKGKRFLIPNHPDDHYKTIIILHRTPNVNFVTAFRQWLCSWLPITIVKALIKH